MKLLITILMLVFSMGLFGQINPVFTAQVINSRRDLNGGIQIRLKSNNGFTFDSLQIGDIYAVKSGIGIARFTITGKRTTGYRPGMDGTVTLSPLDGFTGEVPLSTPTASGYVYRELDNGLIPLEYLNQDYLNWTLMNENLKNIGNTQSENESNNKIIFDKQRFTFSGAVQSLDKTHTPAGSLININDTLIQIFRYAPNGAHIDTGGKIVKRYSYDEGLTWTTISTVYDSIGIDDRNVQIGYKSGILYAWFRRYNITTNWQDCGYIYSTNLGSSWSSYQKVFETPNNITPSHEPGKNGSDSTYMMLYNTGVASLMSSANGIDWNQSYEVYNFGSDTLYYEPTLEIVGDTMIVLIRQDQWSNKSGIFQTYSLDNGATWSIPTPTNLVSTTVANTNPAILHYDSQKNILIAVTGSRIVGDYAIYTYFAHPSDIVSNPEAWTLISRKPMLWDRSYGYPTMTQTNDSTYLVVYAERTTAFHNKDVASFFQFDIGYNTTNIKRNAISRYKGLSATLNDQTGNLDQSSLPQNTFTGLGKLSNKSGFFTQIKATSTSDTALVVTNEALDVITIVDKNFKQSWYKHDYNKVAELDTVGQIGGFQVVWDSSHVNAANKKKDMWIYDRGDSKIYVWSGTYWKPFVNFKTTGNFIMGFGNLPNPSSNSNTIFGTDNLKLATTTSVRNTVFGRANLSLVTRATDNIITGFGIAPIATGINTTTAIANNGSLAVLDSAYASVHIGNINSALLKKSYSSIAIGDRAFRNVKYASAATQIGPGTNSSAFKDSLINTVILGGDIVFSNYGKTATKYTDEVVLGNNNGEVMLWWQEDGRLTFYDQATKAPTLIFPTISTGLGVKFGGLTSAYPYLKRNGPKIDVKVADDSAYTFIEDLYNRVGSGSPEGVVTAPIGAVYHRTDGGAGTSFYVKESGSGSTGWVPK